MFSKKFLIIISVSLLIILAAGAYLYRSLKSEKNQVESQAQDLLDKNGEFSEKPTDAQVAELKQALLFLAQEVGDIKSNDQTTASALEQSLSMSRVSSPNLAGNLNTSADLLIRIKALEEKVSILESKLKLSSPSPSSSSSTNSALKLQYIPLGSEISTTEINGLPFDSYEISLDPADFPNYSTIQLEVVMKMSEAVGEMTVGFYNFTDSSLISGSTITTSSTNFGSYSSSGFRLANGRKTYRLWIKSSAGYYVYVQSARLKVNY